MDAVGRQSLRVQDIQKTIVLDLDGFLVFPWFPCFWCRNGCDMACQRAHGSMDDVMIRHCCSISCPDGPDEIAEPKYPQMSTAVPSVLVPLGKWCSTRSKAGLMNSNVFVFPKAACPHSYGRCLIRMLNLVPSPVNFA